MEPEERTTKPVPRWRRWTGTAAGVFLGGVLLVAAWSKAVHPAAFATQIADEGLAVVLPAMGVALLVLALETFLGTALLLGLRRPWVLWPTAALVAFFVFLTGRAYWRWAHGEIAGDAACGCFGNLALRTPAEAFWQDLLLLVPPLVLAFLGRPRRPAGVAWRVGVVAVLTAGTVVLAWKAPELPLDDLATRLRPGVRVDSLCVRGDDGEECLDSARILPEVASGEAVVVIGELDEELGEAVARLNDYHWAATGPPLYLLTGATEEELFHFHFGYGPAFEVRAAPPAMLRPLYRSLPRSFRVADGEVVETWSGLPPLDRLSAASEAPE